MDMPDSSDTEYNLIEKLNSRLSESIILEFIKAKQNNLVEQFFRILG